MNKLILTILILLVFLSPVYSATKIYEYGFENPTTTTEYPINITAEIEQQEHLDATQMISSYSADEMGQTWTAHSGSYFWIQNDSSDYALSPSISGITQGTVNAHNLFLFDTTYCGTDQGGSCISTDLGDQTNTGEVFIRFWARFNKGWYTIADGGKCKWIRWAGDNGYYPTDDMVYMHLGTSSISPVMYFYDAGIPAFVPSESGPSLTNAYDGNWHKFSMYVNYNNGTILGWYDVDTETVENATKSYTSPSGHLGLTPPTEALYVSIQANYSAKSPTEETYHALDGLEIWDGLPDGGDTTAPTLNTVTINGTSGTFAFDEAVDITTWGTWTATGSTTGSMTVAYASGDGTSSIGVTVSPTAVNGETITITSTGTDINDASSNQFVDVTDMAVTNSTSAPTSGSTTISGSGTGSMAIGTGSGSLGL